MAVSYECSNHTAQGLPPDPDASQPASPLTSCGAKSRPSLALYQSMMRPTKGLINAAPASAHATACKQGGRVSGLHTFTAKPYGPQPRYTSGRISAALRSHGHEPQLAIHDNTRKHATTRDGTGLSAQPPQGRICSVQSESRSNLPSARIWTPSAKQMPVDARIQAERRGSTPTQSS